MSMSLLRVRARARRRWVANLPKIKHLRAVYEAHLHESFGLNSPFEPKNIIEVLFLIPLAYHLPPPDYG